MTETAAGDLALETGAYKPGLTELEIRVLDLERS
jgi:hypothetical protein